VRDVVSDCSKGSDDSHCTYHPDLPVEESVLDELVLEGLRASIVVELESGNDEVTLLVGQELGSLGVVEQHPEGSCSDYDCRDSFKNENPSL